MQSAFDFACTLIERPSVTPDDAGCQQLIADRLAGAGFVFEQLRFGAVDNLWCWHGQGRPVVCFAGHTDVVPPGPVERWASDPFRAIVRDGLLYGRGAADMKSSIASFLVAAEDYVLRSPHHRGTVALLLTSDEEGPAVDGTARVVEHLRERGQAIDYCIVGEPTSVNALGDTIKNGRRGSLSGRLTVRGIQGHVAYPQLARNPIHLAAPVLAELAQIQWDRGDELFPPTTWQASNIRAGSGATNVIPAQLEVDFNFRFAPLSPADSLCRRFEDVLKSHGLQYELAWTGLSKPYITARGSLVECFERSIETHTGQVPALSTDGGTSDGRFIATLCREVVEFGPVNESIHKINEHVDVRTFDVLPRIYRDTIAALLA